ncbi:prevent-host-death protein [Thermosipho melanesiensis]|uniref:Antitoxin n=2 Tax=Thermosipho melanesiensis TaxID=46541 RepID=A6LM66_THEM4|nr:type II toxin-antitoxin system Phd/YefM family antitoxin [Thermosipho melanesiensis]ABR31017.1 prevent-host-death family protein [Thermosipho melanesiensis BI429]APT74111.1 prevent-host-death protein [Thermosipho melanesiensis]OOC36058.1 prevent-host-death protein [Thermosipho melanesiensis]OOC36875.1 prevent-host-death protein [Thermosipho melanesiensis]OOC37626.1 prevent-host-death protein [Thermosipho melanesiensis]
MFKEKSRYYSIAEAKAKFSKVIEESGKKNIIITKNGKPVSVIISYEKFEKVLNFLENVWELYLLEVGDPSQFNKLKLEDFFEDK